MQRNLNSLLSMKLKGTDGEIGKLKDFYFDDISWTIRHLILKTGSWFSERDVLISPDAVIHSNWEPGIIPVRLTKDQMLKSPDIETDKPVARQQEIEIYGHNLWQPYWGNTFYTTGLWDVGAQAQSNDQNVVKNDNEKDEINNYNRHLRSTQVVTGFHIQALDGGIGHVIDFIFEDLTWQITHAAVDTHNWIGGKKILIPVLNIREIQWAGSKVFVNENMDSIKNGLPFEQLEYEHAETENVTQ
jgi:hypothetical protein